MTRIYISAAILILAHFASAGVNLEVLSPSWTESIVPSAYAQQAKSRGLIARKMFTDSQRAATIVWNEGELNGEKNQLIKDIQIGFRDAAAETGTSVILNELRRINGRELLHQEMEARGYRVAVLSDVRQDGIDQVILSAPISERDELLNEASKVFPIQRPVASSKSTPNSTSAAPIGRFLALCIIGLLIVVCVLFLRPKKTNPASSAGTFDVTALKQNPPNKTEQDNR